MPQNAPGRTRTTQNGLWRSLQGGFWLLRQHVDVIVTSLAYTYLIKGSAMRRERSQMTAPSLPISRNGVSPSQVPSFDVY